MKKSNVTRSLLAAVSIVALSAVMYGCVHNGGSDTPPPVVDPDPEPTAYETGKAAIMTATTAAAAQAAYDAVDLTAVTGAQAASLKMALDNKLTALATAARIAMQKMALSNAAGMLDTDDLSTQELVDAARTAIAALRQAIEDAADVSDADKAMYQTQLDNAVTAVDMAQGGIDTATRRTNQMAALTSASSTLQTALAALSGSTPTQAQLDAANAALTALNDAITAGADLTDAEKATYVREATNAAAPIATAQMAFDDAQDDATKAANAAMAATAAKLYAGISAPAGEVGTYDPADRIAGYDTAETSIVVQIGDGTNTATEPTATLSLDKKTTVADLHGWKGKRYIDPAGGDSYEAVVYSNVEAPKQGRKFGGTAAGEEFEYTLPAGGMLAIPSAAGFASGTNDATAAQVAARVRSSSFDHSAGVKRFPLPDPNPNAATIVTVSGTFHGVSGTYSCTPAAAVCAARVVDGGFELGTVPSATDATFTASDTIWEFRPSNASARVMSAEDTMYASYGWWLKKTADGQTFTASAFVDEKGTVADASGLNALNGKATYRGGAAGKYALSSALAGGMNDAGHFTARATLEANFTNNTAATAITGTIDQFMGADGMSRDWSVKLNGSTIGDTGVIGNVDDGTEWTIGGTAAADDGQWTGMLRNNGDDGVPKVATGTFYSTYGTAGKMVGAFGANKQ